VARIPEPGVKRVIFYSAVLTALIEGLTILLRFGLHLEATRDTASTFGRLSGGIRIHHGYFGLLAVLVAAAVLRRWPTAGRWILVIGVALVCSDLMHHFLVLWPIVGRTEFYLFYP